MIWRFSTPSLLAGAAKAGEAAAARASVAVKSVVRMLSRSTAWIKRVSGRRESADDDKYADRG